MGALERPLPLETPATAPPHVDSPAYGLPHRHARERQDASETRQGLTGRRPS
jgi:hypothetical protein